MEKGIQLPRRMYEGFECTGGTILFAEDIRSKINIRSLCYALHNLVEKGKYQEINLDFSLVTKVWYPPILALISRVGYYRETKDIKFEIKLPFLREAENLFINARWAHYLMPEVYELRDLRKTQTHLPTLQFSDYNSVDNVVDTLLDFVLKKAPGIHQDHLEALDWALSEIADNVVTHSYSHNGGFVHLEVNNKKQTVSFCAIDSGLGIPKTLRSAVPEYDSDVIALQNCIKEGVTSRKENQGNGLYGSYEVAVASEGKFIIESGSARLAYRNNQQVISAQKAIFPGTYIECEIGLSEKENFLQRALVIKGKPHKPISNFIDKRFVIEGSENLIYVMKERCDSFRLRAKGTLIQNELFNLIVNSGDRKVIVDFNDISVVSSSFADEVFGKLVKKVGFIYALQKIEFKNIAPTVRSLIDRAIHLRMSTPD